MSQQIEDGPDNDRAQILAGRSVAEMRAAYERSFTLGQDLLLHWENVTVQWLLGLREIGSLIGRNADVNIHAIFDLAEQQVRARSASEIATLHYRFLRDQADRLAEQVKELEVLVDAQIRSVQDEFQQGPGR